MIHVIKKLLFHTTQFEEDTIIELINISVHDLRGEQMFHFLVGRFLDNFEEGDKRKWDISLQSPPNTAWVGEFPLYYPHPLN